jgi:hypothetical protein
MMLHCYRALSLSLSASMSMSMPYSSEHRPGLLLLLHEINADRFIELS